MGLQGEEMLSRLHKQLGTAGLSVAIVALVLAIGGTALAASGALTGKQKKEVKNIAKQYAGKPGATGATGPAGLAGAAGPAGPKGDTGAKGDTGSQGNPGTPGAAGKSVVLTTEAKGANCAEGGTKVEVEGNAASKKYVCNGVNGTSGFTDTLPPGKTETGTWSILISANKFHSPNAYTSISFPIPLAEGSEEGFVFNQEKTELEEFGSSGCEGTVEEPTAPPGVLCVYTIAEERENLGSSAPFETRSASGFGFGPTGAFIVGPPLEGTAADQAYVEAKGTWAVTAPTP